MKGFFERLQGRMAAMMQGRHGTDNLSNALVVAGLVLVVLAALFGLDLLSWVALVILAWACFRCFSRNEAKRASENEAYLRLVSKPKKTASVVSKAWKNRKTTRYFKCKGCGKVLSVPRGKGKLRVTCPQCHQQTIRKS